MRWKWWWWDIQTRNQSFFPLLLFILTINFFCCSRHNKRQWKNIVCDLLLNYLVSFSYFRSYQVALKRQQAVEDAIALRLVNETGTHLDQLPPGKIYGMTVTEPCPSPPISQKSSPNSPIPVFEIDKSSATTTVVTKQEQTISQNAIDMLAQLFPHRKRSVLELILKRCNSDLIKAIEQCSKPSNGHQTGIASAFRPPAPSQQVAFISNVFILKEKQSYRKNLLKVVDMFF